MSSAIKSLRDARIAVVEARRKKLIEQFGYTENGSRLEKPTKDYRDGIIYTRAPYTRARVTDHMMRDRAERRFIWLRGELHSREV